MPRRLNIPSSNSPEDLARAAHLRYISDQEPGLSRHRQGRGFSYVSERGSPLRDPRKIRRIETLAIPPAWQDVWICPSSTGHLQATGRDARQRKQYIYHERWNEVAALAKFTRLAEFGDKLPQLRRAIAALLRGRQLNRQRVLAGMVAVLDLTAIRVGNEEYVKQNSSYGLASLRNRHVTVGRRSVELRFRAKGGVQRVVTVDVPAVVRVIRDCAQLNGSHVFQYLDDDDGIHAVTAGEVNDQLKLITGEETTAKDFRTWKASAFAVGALFARKQQDETAAERKRTVRDVVCQTAEMLSNTPTVCRNYYIHPGLLDCYEMGKFLDVVGGAPPRGRKLFSVDEQLLSRFLKNWQSSIG